MVKKGSKKISLSLSVSGSQVAGSALTFTASGGSGTQYDWVFGDGQTSSTTDPSVNHVYDDIGPFTCTVTNKNKHASVGVNIALPALPTVDAGLDKTGNEGANVTFSGSVTGLYLTSKTWYFGDGSSNGSGTLTPTHAYADNGVFTVTLVAIDKWNRSVNDTCTATVSNVAPIPAISGPTVGVIGQTLNYSGSATDPSTIDASGGYTFHWDFGDGNTQDFTSPVQSCQVNHSYQCTGRYNMTLQATDKDNGQRSTLVPIHIGIPDGPSGILYPSGQVCL